MTSQGCQQIEGVLRPGVGLQEESAEAVLAVATHSASPATKGELPHATSDRGAVKNETDMVEASWGLDILVMVGRHWIPKLLHVRSSLL
jgi:hypothetical protein